MQNLRIKFSKTNDAIYISHLDLMRCFQRAVSRSGIPIGYTEGFNPRPYMNFAMPLSLGIAGLAELVDMKIEDSMSAKEVKERLEKVMPPDIKILDVAVPVNKATQVAFSKFKIEVCQDKMPAEDFNNEVLKLVALPELLVSKIGKQGKNKVVKYINLTEHINDLKSWVNTEKDINSNTTETSIITLVLPSNPQFGINPNLFTNKIFEELQIEPIFCHITRKAILKEDFTPLT